MASKKAPWLVLPLVVALLGSCGDGEGVAREPPPLTLAEAITALDTEGTDDRLRMRAYARFRQIDGEDDSAVPSLTRALASESALLRHLAAEALEVFGGDARTAIPALVRVMLYDDAPPEAWAFYSDGAPVEQNAFASDFGEDSTQITVHPAEAAGRALQDIVPYANVPPRKIRDSIVDALSRPERGLGFAYMCFGEISGAMEAARAAWGELLLNGDLDGRLRAVQTLRGWQEVSGESQWALDIAYSRLDEEPVAAVRRQVVPFAMENIEEKSALVAVGELLRDSEPSVRDATLAGLKDLVEQGTPREFLEPVVSTLEAIRPEADAATRTNIDALLAAIVE